jgi:hypothetical protein
MAEKGLTVALHEWPNQAIGVTPEVNCGHDRLVIFRHAMERDAIGKAIISNFQSLSTGATV